MEETRRQHPLGPFVVARRAVLDQYASRPWAEVLAAATDGRDGLRVVQSPEWNRPREQDPLVPNGWRHAPGWDDWDEIDAGKTWLYQQNW